MPKREVYENIAPIDFRYFDSEAAKYLSEDAFTKYKLKVEGALVSVLAKRGICSQKVADEIKRACKKVTTEEVYAEEKRIGHDIRALVNCIQSKVSDEAKPFVHMTATSYDIIDTANALRFKEATRYVIVPAARKLMKTLIDLTEREAKTPQIGRTHGQHAVPITFGFTVASYVSRLGKSLEELEKRSRLLTGKFSGAVGAYNASSLFFDDPEQFEKEVLATVKLKPAEHSTQVGPPEPLVRLMSEVTTMAGVLANVADDMRNLQRSEVGEVGEAFGKDQVGSSTMPQKRNPIGFENVKSLFKVVVPRMQTVYLDQISEHQRDLTNSASQRSYPEIVGYTATMVKRLDSVMQKLTVDKPNLERNLAMTRGLIAAEPLYIILASYGHPKAHEAVRQLTLRAQAEKKSLWEAVSESAEFEPYLNRCTQSQIDILKNPDLYIGQAAKKAKAIAASWRLKLKL